MTKRHLQLETFSLYIYIMRRTKRRTKRKTRKTRRRTRMKKGGAQFTKKSKEVCDLLKKTLSKSELNKIKIEKDKSKYVINIKDKEFDLIRKIAINIADDGAEMKKKLKQDKLEKKLKKDKLEKHLKKKLKKLEKDKLEKKLKQDKLEEHFKTKVKEMKKLSQYPGISKWSSMVLHDKRKSSGSKSSGSKSSGSNSSTGSNASKRTPDVALEKKLEEIYKISEKNKIAVKNERRAQRAAAATEEWNRRQKWGAPAQVYNK